MVAGPFRIEEVYELSRPYLTDAGPLGRELAAVEEAAALGPVPPRFLAGLSEPALREHLRRTLLRVRNERELARLRLRYAELDRYFPPRRAA